MFVHEAVITNILHIYIQSTQVPVDSLLLKMCVIHLLGVAFIGGFDRLSGDFGTCQNMNMSHFIIICPCIVLNSHLYCIR